MNADPRKLADRARELHEFNPMLGFRGCRLAIAYPEIAEAGTQRTSLDSLLGVGWPLTGLAVSTMENSCRTSPLLVYRMTCLGSE